MTAPYTIQSDHEYLRNRKGIIMADEQENNEVVEWVMVGEAATILGIKSRQGVHYILNHLPKDAPEVRRQEFNIGKNTIFQFAKSDIEALRDYRLRKKS